MFQSIDPCASCWCRRFRKSGWSPPEGRTEKWGKSRKAIPPDVAHQCRLGFKCNEYIWVWINTYENTIFSGMNIHLPAILMSTTGVQGFDTLPYSVNIDIVKPNVHCKFFFNKILYKYRLCEDNRCSFPWFLKMGIRKKHVIIVARWCILGDFSLQLRNPLFPKGHLIARIVVLTTNEMMNSWI